MKLLVINPNTSETMTQDIRQTIERIKAPDMQVQTISPDFGPESLESFYDYTLAAFGLCRLLRQREETFDGILIACYGDPGLYAIKEIVSCPVLGIAEASIALSTLMGDRFAILAASEKAVPMMRNMVTQYGMSGRFAGVWPLNMSVLDAEKEKAATISRLISVGRSAIEAGAEVLILGCAGMTGMKDAVSEALEIPVIDPVESAYLMLEMMVKNNCRISKKGLYQTPQEKKIKLSELLYSEKEGAKWGSL